MPLVHRQSRSVSFPYMEMLFASECVKMALVCLTPNQIDS